MVQNLDERVQEVLRQVGTALNIAFERSEVELEDLPSVESMPEAISRLVAGAAHIGIFVKASELKHNEIAPVLQEGYPIVVASPDDSFWVFTKSNGSMIEATHISDSVRPQVLRSGHLAQILRNTVQVLVVKKELECESMSVARTHHHHGHDSHGHIKPMRRFLSLLRLEQRDIWTISLFALVAGILGLATPLAIESLVNVVSWGTYLQPLLVLAIMLLACLGLAGFLGILQIFVIELIQRRLLVRFVGDLSHRFPRASQAALMGEYPREVANRMFDIISIQKAIATILLDGISIVLTTIVGLLLLAFYHPFLLGFDLVLVLSMISVTWILGRGGISTAIEESIVKYRIVHWLQDVVASPSAFKVNGGETLAVERSNRLVTEYLNARQRQFRVVLRQTLFAVSVQVIASTALLGLGGWLVIRQQLTLGQLVASELVVTIVVGAFAKAGKSLEKFYDLMAGFDKVGHLLDIPVDPRFELGEFPIGPVDVRWQELSFHDSATGSALEIRSAKIERGARAAILASNLEGGSQLLRCLAGLLQPAHGIAEIGGVEARRASLAGNGTVVGYAGKPEIFNGSLHENVDLARSHIGQNRVREVLGQVGLWDDVLRLTNALNTQLQTDGQPLSKSQIAQLTLAQAMAGKPRLLLLNGILDELAPQALEHVWPTLSASDAPWTLLLVTNNPVLADRCTTLVRLEAE